MPKALLPTTSTRIHSHRNSYRYLASAVVGGCAILGIYAGTSATSSVFMELALDRAAGKHPFAFQMESGLRDTQILAGISGETFDQRVTGLKLADLARAAINDRNALSPVALDRLSAGDCITLTTSAGQKLSFRIVGTRNAEPSRDASGVNPSIDLAITACAPSSDAILKAVIESKTDGKQSAVQRSL